jgi:hypothetical protein
MLLFGEVSATGTCTTTDVQITAAWLATDSNKTNVLVDEEGNSLGPINALSCVGSFYGNDQPQPTTNLGWLNDGWANGEECKGGGQNAETFEGDLFIGQVNEHDDDPESANYGEATGKKIDSGLELQALKNDDKDDPGWITVGKYEACDDANCTGEFLSPELKIFQMNQMKALNIKTVRARLFA